MNLSFIKNNLNVYFLSFFYFLFFLISNRWLSTTVYHSYYILFVHLFLSLIFTIPFLFLFFLIKKLEFSYLNLIFYSLIWSFFEWLRLFFLSGFPFSPLGSFFCSIPLFQRIVGFFGVYGCSFVVVLVSLCLIKALKDKKIYLSVIILLFISLSFFVKSQTSSEVKPKVIRVFPVQPGGLVSEKTYSKEFLSTFVQLDDQLLVVLGKLETIIGKKVELILLPEGALTGFIDQESFSSYLVIDFFKRNNLVVPDIFMKKYRLSQLDIFKEIAVALDSTIVFGGNRYDEFFSAYNSLVAVNPCRNIQFYDKRILVPMGETIPLNWLSSLAKRYGITGVYQQGKENFIKIGEFIVLPSICYEDCFPLLGWSDFSKKPDFIINITNDGWFYPSSLPKIHSSLSKIRVLELGIPMVRSCEQSQSGWISADGTSFLFDERSVVLPILDVPIEKVQKYYFKIKEKWIFSGFFFVLLFKLKGIFNRLRFKLAQKRELV